MSSKKINETKNLFDGLNNNKNKEKDVDKSMDIEDDKNVDVNTNKIVNNDTNEDIVNGDVFSSLLENENPKEEYIRATHYFRKDQLDDITKFAKKANKGKNEFMRDVLDLVFTQLKK